MKETRNGGASMSDAALPLVGLTLIQRSAWKEYSRKVACGILHGFGLRIRQTALCPGRSSTLNPHLVVPRKVTVA